MAQLLLYFTPTHAKFGPPLLLNKTTLFQLQTISTVHQPRSNGSELIPLPLKNVGADLLPPKTFSELPHLPSPFSATRRKSPTAAGHLQTAPNVYPIFPTSPSSLVHHYFPKKKTHQTRPLINLRSTKISNLPLFNFSTDFASFTVETYISRELLMSVIH